MTDNPTPNDIALLREARKWFAENCYGRLPAGVARSLFAALAPGQHDGAAGEGQRELEYFNRTTCACTAAGAYVADCDKHSAKPSTEQARAEDVQTYEVDDRGLFCRHCGRASWLHHRVIGAGNFCVSPDATPSGADALGGGR